MQHPPARRFLGRIGRAKLQTAGPTLDVDISLPESVAALRGADPVYPTEALIDTGANVSAISPLVAQSLGLMPVQQMEIGGVHDNHKVNVYVVKFTFRGSGILLMDWLVTEAKNLTGRPFEMLIGRDVLKHFLLVYDGARGDVGLEFPSESHPLERKPWVSTLSGGDHQHSGAKKHESKAKSRKKMAKASRKKNR